MVAVVCWNSEDKNCHEVSKYIKGLYPSSCNKIDVKALKKTELLYYVLNGENMNANALTDLINNEEYLSLRKKFIILTNKELNELLPLLKYHLNSDVTPDVLHISYQKFKLDPTLSIIEKEEVRQLLKDFKEDNICLEESSMAVVFHHNQVLATKELIYGKEVLSLPKGHIEAGETHITAGIRECFEETNYRLNPSDLILEIEPFSIKFVDHHYKIIHKVIYPLLFYVSKEGELCCKEERILEVKFLDIAEFLSCCSYSNVRDIVSKCVEIISLKK